MILHVYQESFIIIQQKPNDPDHLLSIDMKINKWSEIKPKRLPIHYVVSI